MKKNKTLLIIRHAKSSWELDVNDKDRALNSRGVNDAHLVSKHLTNSVFYVDYVLSSPANRALHTCMIFMRNLKLNFDTLRLTDSLYDFGGDNVINTIKLLNDDYNTVMLFGHNHAFTSIANMFGDKYIDNLPTSGFVAIEFNVNSWAEISTGKTINMVFPKQLKS